MRGDEIKYGYTIGDLDAMARAAVRADRSMVSGAHTRYGIAWSAIALALVEAPHWPRRERLVQAGWQAIYADVRGMRHALGMASRPSEPGSTPMAAGSRAQAYWYRPVVAFEDGLVERLAVGPVLATLTGPEREAVVALAVHDNYLEAAQALGISYKALTQRLSAARRRFYRRWYYPEAAPPVRGTDRRVEAHGRALATHCGAGHPWTPENTRPRVGQSGRNCRACERARIRPSRAKAPA